MTFSTLGTDTQTGKPVYLYKASRTQGLYIVGLQGMGKSGLLENLIIDDIKQGLGVCVLDPHGELIDHVIARLPGKAEEEKVIYLDLTEKNYSFGLNLFDCADPTDDGEITQTVNQVTHVFEKAFGISMVATPRIYDYLFNSAYTLIANPGYTMIDIPLLFNDACRHKLLLNVTSTEVTKFWNDYKQLPQQEQSSQAREILRRLNDLSHFPLRYVVGQGASTINLQKIMDEGKILLVKLDRLREQATSLIGSIIVALILNASAARTTHKQFHLNADEFQRFATEDFATLLEEARKAGIGITMAHQNRAQLELSDKQADSQLKARTLNVGSLVVFRVPTDANVLAYQFDTTPPLAEPRMEYKRTIVRKPVDYYLSSGRSHPVEAVSRFFYLWRDIHNKKEDGKIDVNLNPHFSGSVHKSLRSSAFNYRRVSMHFLNGSWELLKADEEMEKVNSYFYEMMRTKNPFVVFPLKLFYTALVQLKPACFDIDGFYLFHNNARVEFHSKYEPRDYVSYVFRLFGEEITDAYGNIKPRSPSVRLGNFRNVYDALWLAKNEQQLQSAFTNYEQAVCRSLRIDLLFALKNILIRKNAGGVGFLVTREYTGLSVPRGSAAYEKQKQESFLDELRHRLEFSELSSLTDMVVPLLPFEKIKWQIREDKVQDWYDLEDFDETLLLPAVEKEIENIVSCCKPSFEQVVREIRDVCQAIVTHPIEDISGVIEEKPGTTMTYADVANKIASELIHLPIYTARVKLTDASDTIVEHTIATREPEKGVYGRHLQERIERIKEQNKKPNPYGYTRPRPDIETEIAKRQSQCSGGSSPAQTQKPQHPLQPQGRLMPICSSCGAQNQPGAKFCNQCGTPI